jgi:TetR/AcrR family transcriptional regulator
MTTAQERKQQERQARRRRIQQAARTVFAERGYAKTSIEQVARQASLSVGAIYLYFRSKEDLYISLIEETLESFDAELSAIRTRPDLPPTNRLQAAWSHLTGWAVSDIEGTRILRLVSQSGVRKQLSDEVAVAAATGIEKIRNHFAALIQAGVEAGRYRHVEPQETADLLWSLFIGVLETSDARKNLGLEGPSFPESAQAAFVAIEGGMLAMAAHVAEAA